MEKNQGKAAVTPQQRGEGKHYQPETYLDLPTRSGAVL